MPNQSSQLIELVLVHVEFLVILLLLILSLIPFQPSTYHLPLAVSTVFQSLG